MSFKEYYQANRNGGEAKRKERILLENTMTNTKDAYRTWHEVVNFYFFLFEIFTIISFYKNFKYSRDMDF